MSTADIRPHAIKKKAAAEAGPSRPSKKGQVTTPSILTRKSDIPSKTVPKPILILSAPTMLSEALLAEDGMVGEDGAATVPSMALSAEVQTGTGES